MTTQRSDDALVERLWALGLVLYDADESHGPDNSTDMLREAADRIATLSARVDLLAKALAESAIPLEVLNMDNGLGAKWMVPALRIEVANAVKVIRAALDVATRSADTDGDEKDVQGLHAPEAREHLARDGASSARNEAVE